MHLRPAYSNERRLICFRPMAMQQSYRTRQQLAALAEPGESARAPPKHVPSGNGERPAKAFSRPSPCTRDPGLGTPEARPRAGKAAGRRYLSPFARPVPPLSNFFASVPPKASPACGPVYLFRSTKKAPKPPWGPWHLATVRRSVPVASVGPPGVWMVSGERGCAGWGGGWGMRGREGGEWLGRARLSLASTTANGGAQLAARIASSVTGEIFGRMVSPRARNGHAAKQVFPKSVRAAPRTKNRRTSLVL
jgi:hypothetical protein